MNQKILTWAVALTLAVSSATAFAGPRDQAAVIGGVIGAFAGAVVGQQMDGSGGVLPGILIGAAAGATIGSAAAVPSRGYVCSPYRSGYRDRYATPDGYYYRPAPRTSWDNRPVRYAPDYGRYYGRR